MKDDNQKQEDQGLKESRNQKEELDQDSQEEKKEVEEECNCENCDCKEDKTDEYKNKYIRALADYQNLAKRIERERGELITFASVEIIRKLLPIFDDLQLANEHLKDKGIELIYNKFWKLLKEEGVAKIHIKESDIFDPTLMECIEAQDGGNKLQEIRAGYTIKGKVIRPAQVKVVK